VQSAVIPLALGGADLIACAETGTGSCSQWSIRIELRVHGHVDVGRETAINSAISPHAAIRVVAGTINITPSAISATPLT
jgi:hypothetical protein